MDEKSPEQPKLAEWPHRVILASRWLLIVFYGVLMIALAAFALAFVVHAAELLTRLLQGVKQFLCLNQLRINPKAIAQLGAPFFS